MRNVKFMTTVVVLLLTAVCADARKKKDGFLSDPENNIFVGWTSVGSESTMSGLTMYTDAVTMAFRHFASSLMGENGKISGMCSVKYLKSQMVDDSMFYVWLEIRPEGDCRFEAETSILQSLVSDSSGNHMTEADLLFSIKVYNEDTLIWQSMMQETTHQRESSSSFEIKVHKSIISSSQSEQLSVHSVNR